jgi:hypothetical protein
MMNMAVIFMFIKLLLLLCLCIITSLVYNIVMIKKP